MQDDQQIQGPRRSVAVLDTSVLIDRLKSASRRARIQDLLGAFDCKRGRNKFCTIEKFIRERSESILGDLHGLAAVSEQFARAAKVFESVNRDQKRELSHSDCRRAGDCLIALEAQNHASHAISTNAREWEPIAKLVGLEFVRVLYPDEETGRG